MDCLNHLIVYPLFQTTVLRCVVCKCTINCAPSTGVCFHRMCGIKPVYALLDSLNDESQQSYMFYISWPVMKQTFDNYITEDHQYSLPYYYSTRQPGIARAVVNNFVFRTNCPSLLQLVKNI